MMKKCPICGKDENPAYVPFCSKRCADIDLNRWFNGTYVIHTNEGPEDDSGAEKSNPSDD